MPKAPLNAPLNLDHAAGTKLNSTAKKELLKFISSDIYNPDSSYQPAVELRRYLADLKNKLAKLLGVNSPSIFITNGSSDATSKLFKLLLADKNLNLITTNVEHQTLLAEAGEYQNQIIKVSPKNGILSLSKLKQAISPQTILISVQYVNNETGIIQPIKDLAQLIKRINHSRLQQKIELPLFLHSDASQAALTEDIQIPRLGVDALSLNGSKFGALPSSGILYLSPTILRYLEQTKTKLDFKKEDALSLISQYFALQDAIQKKPNTKKTLLKLARSFNQEFLKLNPSAKLNPTNLKINKNHAPHILNYTINGISGEKFVILAGLNGILISTGAACSASKNTPSHVLQALNLTTTEVQSSIRISLGKDLKSESEAKKAALKLSKLLKNESVQN